MAERFEDARAATAEVIAAWQADDASGAVASTDGRIVGYLLGAPKPSPVCGPNIWVEPAGQATAAADTEVMRDLYAASTTRWVEEGRTAHYVLVPSSDAALVAALVAAWFRLDFGHQQTHAVRLPGRERVAARPGLTIRDARRADIPVLARLELELPRHQALSRVSLPASCQPSKRPSPSGRRTSRRWLHHPTTPASSATWLPGRGTRAWCRSGPRRDRPTVVGRAGVRRRGDRPAADQPAVLAAWPALGFEDTFWRLRRTIGY